MCLELSDIEDAVLSKYDSDLLIDVDYLNELSDYEHFCYKLLINEGNKAA